MIKVNKGIVEILGIEPIIKSEVTVLLKVLHDRSNFSKEELMEMVDVATMTDEELEKKVQEKENKLKKMEEEDPFTKLFSGLTEVLLKKLEEISVKEGEE